MNIRRASVLTLGLLGVVIVSNFLTATVNARHYSESYPAVACPPSSPGLFSQVSTGTTSTPYRKVVRKVQGFSAVRNSRFLIGSDPILLDADGVTSPVWQSLSGVWAGATLCTSPRRDEWFVGGTADVTSKDRLLIVNSGLSDAIVDVSVWTEKGAQPDLVLTIRANSYVQVPLDAIATGRSRLGIQVAPRSGRVSAFLVDVRGKGLRSLGGDIVNAVESPTNDIVIVGIPQQVLKGVAGPHVIRVLAPGNVDANIQVTLVSSDGVFTPVGLDGRNIPKGTVVDILFNPTITTKTFALRIHSDQPIVASIFSAINVSGHRDFVWNTASPPLVAMKLAVKGLQPTLIFTGDRIGLKIRTRLNSGKIVKSTVSGSDIAVWKAPDNAQLLSISDVRSKMYGASLVTSPSGIGFFPLIPGGVISRAAVPTSNISVINR